MTAGGEKRASLTAGQPSGTGKVAGKPKTDKLLQQESSGAKPCRRLAQALTRLSKA